MGMYRLYDYMAIGLGAFSVVLSIYTATNSPSWGVVAFCVCCYLFILREK